MKKYVQEKFLDKALYFMKWTTILFAFIVTTAFGVWAEPVKGQNVLLRKVTVNIKAQLLPKALEEISVASGVKFTYGGTVANSKLTINADVKGKELKAVLDNILKNSPYTYEAFNDEIIIRYDSEKEKSEKKSSVSPASPAVDIHGKITDEKGLPLPGVTITVKGTQMAFSSDANGFFSVQTLRDNVTLVFSYIGYKTQEIPVSGHQELTVKMVLDYGKLDQVQVIGYGATTRKLNTGDVSTVKANVIESQPVTNPLQALEGRVAGLQIIQGTGLPGSGMQVEIRGRSSLLSNNYPLYIIDGVPFPSANLERIGTPSSLSGQSGSPMNSINPDDIESIDVLKDADATAIYGSRGSNGVILITTKKGSTGKTVFDVNVNNGFGTVTRTAQPLNTAQYLQVRNDAFKNSGQTPGADNAPDLVSWSPNADFDWQKWYIGNTAHQTNATATLSGGDKQTTFLMSGTFHNESSVLPQISGEGYERGNFHLNVGHTSLNKKLHVDATVFFSADKNKLPMPTALMYLVEMNPNYPVYDANGNLNWVNNKTNYIAANQQYDKVENNNLNASLSLKYNLFKGLDFKSNVGYNRIENNQIDASPSTSYDPSYGILGNSEFGKQLVQTFLFEPQLTYTTVIGNGKLDLLAGSTIEQQLSDGYLFLVDSYSSDAYIESLNFGSMDYRTASRIDYKYISVFGRATYNWDDKYILNGSFRRDGSSRFGPGKQFGNFGSIGAAWLFSNEAFLKDCRVLSFGKLHGSYGTTGNDGIGDYGYLSFYDTSTNYGNTSTLIPTQIANKNYQWEVNKKLELGISLGFLKNRILLNAAWYRNRSGNELVSYALPSITGFTGYIANLPAVVQNRGLEFEVNTTNVQSNQFTWTTSINLTIPKNTLLSFPGLQSSGYANSYVVGQPLNIVQKYHFLGVNPADGTTMIQDINNDGKYTQLSSYNGQGGDYVIAGTTDPKWYGGMNNSFRYKGFQLDIFLQYTRQDGYNLYSQIPAATFGNDLYSGWTAYLNYWKNPGDKVTVPKPEISNNMSQTEFQNSDAGFGDASFLRVKNVSLSYMFPSGIVQKWGMKNLRLYLQGQNVLTLTKYKGYDPEQAGSTYLLVPPLKMFTAGLQITF